MQAINNMDFMFLVDQQRVRLQYKGSEKIVVATGIKRETLDEVVA